MTFYDYRGIPVAYTDNAQDIYMFSGEPVAYIADEAVFSFDGKHLGWFENGWLRDLNGNCVFFTEDTNGSGPIKPIKNIKPVKSVKNVKPIKSIKEVRQIKPIKSLGWTSLSGKDFFTA